MSIHARAQELEILNVLDWLEVMAPDVQSGRQGCPAVKLHPLIGAHMPQ